MISYLSKPIASTVKPYSDNIELIAKVAEMKQNKYDQVLSTIFQQQNQLLNLDTLNEKVTNKKNNLLKQADDQLNKLASSDLTIPDNISKVENIFSPITSDSEVLSDVYYTKQIRENQEFAQNVLKKDPSTGNQLNYQASQSLVDLYRKADPGELSDIAPYAKMFSPYVDVKGKISKLLTELKILDPQKFSTTREAMGVIDTYVKEGKISKDQVLQKVNAIFTPEDRQQLMLDGYGDYGRYKLQDLMKNMGTYSKNIDEIEKNSSTIKEKILLLDKNEDGEIDNYTKDSSIDSSHQEQLNDYYAQKNYLEQQQQAYSKGLSYIDKFNKNGDLNIGDKLNFFQFLKETEISQEIANLFESDYNDFTFSHSEKDLFKAQTDRDLETYKERLKRETKALEEMKPSKSSIYVDIDQDGSPEYTLPSIYTTQNQNITETDLEDIYEVKDINERQRFNFNDGTSVAVDIGNTGIKDWESAFTNSMKGASIDGKKYIADNLNVLAVGKDGKVNPEIQKAINAGYELFKTSAKALEDKGKLITHENIPAISDLGQFDVFKQLYEFEKNFQSGNDLATIKTTIESYLLNDLGYKEKIKNSTDAKFFTTMSKKFTPEDFKKIVNNNIYYTSNYREKEKLNSIYDKIKDIPISKNDKPIDIYNKYAEKLGMGKGNHHNLYITNEAFLTIEEKLLKNLSLDTFHYVEDLDPLKENAKRFHEEKQKMYKQLLSKFSPLVINFPVSMTSEAKMKDEFFSKSESLLNAANIEDLLIKNSKNEWIKIDDEEKESYRSAIKDGKNSITLQSYNTGTGELTAKIGGLSEVKYKVNPKTASENGMPYGMNSKDIVGKNLILQTILDPNKIYSPIISAGSLSLGEGMTEPASIFYDKESGSFILVRGTKHTMDPNKIIKTAKSTTELLGIVQQQNADNQATIINLLNK